ncbi:MAG: PilZ domain-containing protein [Vulcanimicrobiota bacterium]
MKGCENRRADSRKSLECQVLMRHMQGKTLNLSATGARVLVESPVRLRTRQAVHVMTPDGQTFSVVAVPVWQQSFFGCGQVVGLHFPDDQTETASLRWWLESAA